MRTKLCGFVAVTMLAMILLALPVISTGQNAEQKSDLDKLLKERRDTLQQIVEVVTEEYHIGKKGFASVVEAKNRFIDAELELVDTRQERLALLRKQVEMFESLSAVLEERAALGVVQQTDRLDARVAVLEAKIKLLREQDKSGKTND